MNKNRPADNVFHHRAHVYFDQLDAMGMLHNSRHFQIAERTESALFASWNRKWEGIVSDNPDQFYVIREQSARYHLPIIGITDVAVDVWIQRLSRTSATYRFAIRSADSGQLHTEIERVHVKLDPDTLRPTEWTSAFSALMNEIVRADAVV